MNRDHRPGVNSAAISHRLSSLWLQTVLGILFLAGLTAGTLFFFGFHWSVGTIVLGIWILLPLFGWYNSGTLVKKLMRCQEPNMNIEDHARLVRIVDELFPKTGLKVKPPVYVSPLPVPNAFATGRNPATSFIAATEGLFQVGLTDEELGAVLAHELAHVNNRDVAITSLTAVLGSIFSLVLAQGLPWIFNSAFASRGEDGNLLDKLENKVRKDKKRFVAATGGVAGFIVMVVLFYIIGIFARLVTLFVSRCRESHADVLAVKWTGDACSLSTALQKIVMWMTFNGPDIRMRMIMRGMTPLLMVSPFDDHSDDAPKGFSLSRWWRRLGENHPPIPERLKALDELSGSSCPRLN